MYDNQCPYYDVMEIYCYTEHTFTLKICSVQSQWLLDQKNNSNREICVWVLILFVNTTGAHREPRTFPSFPSHASTLARGPVSRESNLSRTQEPLLF